MRLKNISYAVALLASSGLSTVASAASWDVKITNLTHGVYFTPLVVSAHNSSTHVFQAGTTASSSLRILAECGVTSNLETDLSAANNHINPASGPLAPGANTTAMITTANNHLSIVAMLLPTNDGFVGIDAQEIPTAAGTYTFYAKAWDAGTEANNELMDTSGCAAGMAGIPADPTSAAGTGGGGVAGADTNTTVHIHRGVLGDSNSSGGASDLSNTVHRWQNPVAKIEVTVTP
ncbi:MAG: spondin domain-containing protein [Gammaproteobacteria bacterium]|nr:spondin domain-containing protein [Gammaproteobacteria bacterium]MDH5694196.1 spondin domain-containing protein [Gammaproteobacteria bacterium]